MSNPLRSVLICAAWLTASTAMAQTAVAPVTVQGSAPPKTVEKRAETFVQSFAAPSAKLGQFARWNDPVCVQVLGLIPAQAAIVAARTEDVAKAVGLKAGRPGCTANIEIAFADQPQQLLDSVAGRADSILGFHYASETKALKTITRPVQAWYKTATRGGGSTNAGLATAMFYNAQGEAVISGGYPGQTAEKETADTPGNGTPTGCADSHFSSCLRSVFKNVLVVVDNGRVKGKDLAPVADYVALLALAQPRSLDGCAALPSVIDLFSPACPGRDAPEGLTPADAAYLTALYATDPEAKKAEQQSDVASRMARILTKANAAGR